MTLPDWRQLRNEEVFGLAEEQVLLEALRSFEPLAYAAGKAAHDWLLESLGRREFSLETHAALSASGDLLGFYALEPVTVTLSRRDRTVLLIRDRRAVSEQQPFTHIAWIARSQQTAPGFGYQLFEHLVANAMHQGRSGLVVYPADPPTARFWRSHYRFMPFADTTGRNETVEPQPLWYPVQPLTGGGWPS